MKVIFMKIIEDKKPVYVISFPIYEIKKKNIPQYKRLTRKFIKSFENEVMKSFTTKSQVTTK